MGNLTELRNGQHVIPLIRQKPDSNEETHWAIDTTTEEESYLRGTAADKLAAYEATGYTPEEIESLIQDVESRALLWFEKNYGITAGRIIELAQADNEKRLLILPVPMGATVFTVHEDFFNCEQCQRGDDTICDKENGQLCPLYIKMHVVEGFTVGIADNGKPVLSSPGEWGCEGLETFSGRDGKWHPTHEAAKAVKMQMEKEGVK